MEIFVSAEKVVIVVSIRDPTVYIVKDIWHVVDLFLKALGFKHGINRDCLFFQLVFIQEFIFVLYQLMHVLIELSSFLFTEKTFPAN